MKMTMSQKILAAHVPGRARSPSAPSLRPGELVMARLDLVLGNDITAPVAIGEFQKFGRATVFDREKIALVPDHFTPNKDIKAAAQCAAMRAFAKEQGIANYFEVGHDCGIEHALLPEKGLVTAGDLVIGADSHTCTYGALGAFSTGVGSTDMAAGMSAGETWFRVPSAIKVVLKGKPRKWVCGKDVILHLIGMIGVDGARYQSLEFAGDGIASLSMDDRFTIAQSRPGSTRPMRTPNTSASLRSTSTNWSRPWRSRTCRPTRARCVRPGTSPSTRWSSAHARTGASPTCALPQRSCADTGSRTA